jgi:lysophospholipase L1-like esterase
MRRLAALAIAVAGLVRAPGAEGAVRVACVGDSTTSGSGNSGVNVYTAPLGRLLGATYDVKNFGAAGTTLIKTPGAGSSYWGTPAFKASQAYGPDIVLIMLGTNDSKAANWRGGNNTYEADYRALIAVYAGLPSKPTIYALTPPPLFTMRSTLDPAVVGKDVPAILRRVAADAGIGFIDVQAAFLPDPKKYFGAGDGIDIGDGTHPNAAGADLIAATVARALTDTPDAGAVTADAAPGDAPPGADRPAATADDAPVASRADARPLGADGGAGGGAPMSTDDASPAPSTPAKAESGCTIAGRGGAPAGVLVGLALLAVPRRRRR